jgi:hypothetical protein
VSGFAERGEAEEGVDGGEAGVAAADAVPALAFEMVEEGADERGVQVGQIQLRGRFAELGLREAEQQPEGVPVGRDGVRAGAALVEQPAGEERLEGGGPVSSWQAAEGVLEPGCGDGE